tara:strand:- start:414 stop:530 length:117 start_codon:yes stop_codon:yes gene_type:complete
MAQELINRLTKLFAVIATFWQNPNHQTLAIMINPNGRW